jgi:hypothetical protein
MLIETWAKEGKHVSFEMWAWRVNKELEAEFEE